MWATIVEVMLGPEALNKLTNVFDVEKDPVKVEWLKKVMHRNFRSHNRGRLLDPQRHVHNPYWAC